MYLQEHNEHGTSGTAFRIIFFIFLLFAINERIYSQSEATTDTTKTDTSVTSTALSSGSLYSGTGYGSNMMYMGSSISQNQPFGYTSITYGFNSEFYLTASFVHLGSIKPFMAFFTGSFYYNHVFNSWFDISAGINRYQVAPSLVEDLFNSFTYLDFTLGIDWRLVYSKITTVGLFADENQVYFEFKNSRYFQTPDFIKRKIFISFDPYISLLSGVITKAETITGTERTGSFIPPFGQGRGRNQTNSETVYSRNFSLMEIMLGLPVAINFKNLTLEAEADYLIPLYDESYNLSSRGFIFMVTGYWRVF